MSGFEMSLELPVVVRAEFVDNVLFHNAR
jgi:hypothetical protein